MISSPIEITKVSTMLDLLRSWSANVICLSESQTAWERHTVRESVAKELRKIDRNAGMVGSSSETATASVVKPGGTLTVWDGNWNSRIVKRESDPYKLGRWSYIEIVGKKNSKLCIYTVYRCCKGQTESTVGRTSSFSQQVTLLKLRGVKKSPQEMLLVDLQKNINEKLQEGCEILVCIDANEQMEDDKSRIKKFSMELGLIDIATARFAHPPPTFVRKKTANRIDFLLCTSVVYENIEAYGMAPLEYERTLGDHRAQYVDINTESLLGLTSIDNSSASSRRLRSTDPKCINKYIDKLRKNFKTHNIHKRMKKLVLSLKEINGMTKCQQEQYEALDRDVFRLCINAEKQIKIMRFQQHAWSPSMEAAAKTIQHWRRRQKAKKENKNNTHKLILFARSIGIEDDESKSDEDIQVEIKQAFRKLNQVKKVAREKRVEFLNGLADKYASDNMISKSQAVLELLNHEEVREMYRHIRLKIKGSTFSQLDEVWIKSSEGETRVISDNDELNEHLLRRNKDQLRQAANTPFGDGPLGKLLKADGSGDIADRILEGLPIPEAVEYDETIQAYLEGMAVSKVSILDSVKTDLTTEQYANFWKNKRETTATSPFGLHIGHFKSVVPYEDILNIHLQLLVIPFQKAYVPTRWAKTVQIMLEKDQGRPWSNRLRIIELFDSQLNAGMQIFFGKRMVDKALKEGLIHPSAYGSVPQRTAQDAVLEKILSIDMMRVKKLTGAIFDCDAKGCYDQIIPALQTIFSRRLGVPIKTARLFAMLWSVCKHHVRTRNGVSSECYYASVGAALYGIGQGNGAGPAFWLSHLVVMFYVLDTLAYGICFKTPQGDVEHRSTGMGFVDDVTLGCTEKNPIKNNDDILETDNDRTKKVCKQITSMAQHWEKMLFADGGRLELKKCYWILISWKWIRGIAVMQTNEETPWEMNLHQSEADQTVTITRQTIKAAPKVLGCHIAVDGNSEKEFGRWRTEAIRFGTKVKKAKFKRTCGEKIYPTIWIPKLRYISAPVCFTREQCETIDKKVVRHCVSASGYHKGLPRAVLYGPSLYGGTEWDTSYLLQVYEKVRFFLGHVRRNDRLGKLLVILVQTIQLVAGINDQILDTEIKWTTWVETTWITFLQTCLWEVNGRIKLECKKYKCPRKQDQFIMDIFEKEKYSEKKLLAINRCRMYLRVLTVSDLCTYDGRDIESTIWSLEKGRDSTMQWPIQIKPCKTDINIWKKAIKSLVIGSDTLRNPLGEWISKTHQTWRYMSNKNKTVLLRCENGVQKKWLG